MRFLADESCDFAVVRALRAAGHDVLTVSEFSPGAEDQAVIGLGLQQGRILLTEDKDFGQLVHAGGRASGGVVFLRFPAKARTRMARVVVDLVRNRGGKLMGSFTVVQPGRVRIMPASED
jgi:predicted nuclease of predicted toxin-antitoxin system